MVCSDVIKKVIFKNLVKVLLLNLELPSLTLWQAVGGSMPVERQPSMEGICGRGQKDAPRGGQAFTGSLARGSPTTLRRPRSPYDQSLQPRASTEPLLEFSQTLISNVRSKCPIVYL